MKDNMNLTEKTVVITGASKGLGRELALNLSKSCSNLVLLARSIDLLEILKSEIVSKGGNSPTIIKCDISEEEDVKYAAKTIQLKFRKVDILINNAGIANHKLSEKISYNEMRNQFKVNFFGAFYCINEFLPLLKTNKTGYILNVGSLVSNISFEDNSVYSATKSALKRYTEGLRLELKKYNIGVGLLQSGVMDTSFNDDRSNEDKVPSFMVIKVEKVVNRILKMIEQRESNVKMYEWMLLMMRLKKLVA